MRMLMRLRLHLLCAILGVPALLSLALPAAAQPAGRATDSPATPLLDRVRAFDAAVDTLHRDHALRDSLWSVSESLMQEADAAADDAARVPLLHARAYLLAGRGETELATIQRGLDLSRSRGDSLAEMQFLVQLGGLYRSEGRRADLEKVLVRLLELSDAHQGTLEAALADNFIATRWIHSGRGAQAGPVAERARAVFEHLGKRDRVVTSETLLGITGMLASDIPAARAHYRRGIELARRIHRDDLLVALLGNLSTLERGAGRYDRALEAAVEMKAAAHRAGDVRSRGFALQGTSYIMTLMGRNAEAIAESESLLVLGTETQSLGLRSRALSVLALAYANMGDWLAASRCTRAIVAMGDSIGLGTYLDAKLNLCNELLKLDSLRTSLALARETVVPAGHMGVLWEIRSANVISQAERRAGRLDRAIAALEGIRYRFKSGEPTIYETSIMADLAGLYARTAMIDSANSCIARAKASYFRNRRELDDDEWRERIANEGAAIASAELRVQLRDSADREAIMAAFDRTEPLRSRTLLERIAGREEVDSDSAAFATAADLQARLEPGEVFLQWTVTEDTSVVFVFTKDDVGIFPLGVDADSLKQQARELRRFIAQRPDGQDDGRAQTLSAAARSMGQRMFGPFAERLRSARRVIVSPDGPLYQLPMAFVLRKSVFAGHSNVVPEVVSTPSATLLLRARGRTQAPERHGLLAESGPAPDGSGPLPGARDEVRWLARSFAPVTARVEATVQDDSVEFADYAGLHFAAHAESNDLLPWQSGILLGPADAARDDGYVRAGEIVGMHLPAKIAVLSACETAWGAILSGEGLVGMSTAFLSAGVPTVVATQWKVDDRATMDFMKVFYRELAHGSTASAALLAAQVHTASSSHGDPYYWAGFVLTGEPGTTLRLRERGPTPAALALWVVALAAADLHDRLVDAAPRFDERLTGPLMNAAADRPRARHRPSSPPTGPPRRSAPRSRFRVPRPTTAGYDAAIGTGSRSAAARSAL